MSEISINYTARDYESLKQELINLVSLNTGKAWTPSDNSDLGAVLVEAFAYMGDIMSYYIDRAANETLVETAVKTETLLNFASLYGIKPSGPTPAEVSIDFVNVSDKVVDLPIGTQVMAPLNYGPFSQAYFETIEGYTAIQPNQTITINAIEGKTVNTDREDYIDSTYHKPLPLNLGTSNGLANQEIQILDTGVLDASLIVYVGQGIAFAPWAYVDTLVEYGPESLVFTTSQNSDGTLNVIFGDNVNGAIPPSGQLISALYKTSVGRYGNVISGAITELSFIPGNIDPESLTYFSVNNGSAAIGGADADDFSQLRKRIKASIISRRRAVTLSDYEYLAYQVTTLGRAKASSAVYSLVNLYIQSQNDGTSTPGIVSGSPTTSWGKLKTAVENYLADKIPVGVTLNVQQPTYVPVYLDVAISIGGAYKRSTVRLAIYKALLGAGGLFEYDKNEFGRTIPLSTVIAALAGVDGVVSANVTKLNIDNTSTATTVVLSNNQIPYLLPANLTITVTGGINL
jgi:uncharacterized phage protein gp47/JayE